MNNDLISREALKKEIEQYQIQWNKNCDIDIAKWNCCGTILAIIDNAPTVEERSYEMGYQDGCEDGLQGIRPQGEWIFQKANEEQTDGYECSNCKACFHTKVPYFSEFNFCPNCGADMRGDNNEM